MDQSELYIKGIGISKEVLATIVSMSAEKVDGVAHVGENIITSSLISVITQTPSINEEAVVCEVVNDQLQITIHLAVFFGYQFTELAEEVRTRIARDILEQVGVDVACVNVCIDSLVFPKE